MTDADSDSPTVLVIDDDALVLDLASRALTRAGYVVHTAYDGGEGVAAVGELGDRIDLVILDVALPDMGGDETLRRMRSVRSDLTVILSSGLSLDTVKKKFDGQTYTGFLAKPYRPRELVDRVAAVLAP